MRTKSIKIPKHSDKALRELHELGLWIHDYANYRQDYIIGYRRWGRGFKKDIIRKCDSYGE